MSLSRRLAHVAVVGLAVMSLAREANARELWSQGEASIDFSGSLRQIGLYSKQTDLSDWEQAYRGDPSCLFAATVDNCRAWDDLQDADAVQMLTRIRVRFDLQATSWLSAVVAYDSQLFYGRIDTLEATLGRSLQMDTFFGAEGVIASGQHARWTHRLYRGYVQAEGKGALARFGRQRISWGVGNLWNPIDRFDPRPPLDIQANENVGSDALLLRWSWAGFNFVEGVYAPGAESEDSRYAGHVHVVFFDTDISLMGGLYQEAPTVGFDIARNLGDAVVYLEAVWADPKQPVWRIGDPFPAPPEDFWQVVAGAHHVFDVGTGLYVLLEHLYNGNALGFGAGKAGTFLNFFESANVGAPALVAVPASNAISGTSAVVTFAKNQTGLQLGYDILPELRADFLTLYDWEGKSAAFTPTLSYAALDFLDLRLGAQFFAGKRLSQYGGRSHLLYFLVDVFF